VSLINRSSGIRLPMATNKAVALTCPEAGQAQVNNLASDFHHILLPHTPHQNTNAIKNHIILSQNGLPPPPFPSPSLPPHADVFSPQVSPRNGKSACRKRNKYPTTSTETPASHVGNHPQRRTPLLYRVISLQILHLVLKMRRFGCDICWLSILNHGDHRLGRR
jgi:hypothetical protein